ncbi:peptidoglycan-binding domain-containing protein [Hyphomicrobium sp. CS1GBMeth3]|uniref:peptidoglycan-binding domain-containing protein n=1 Tax=Hyphomicrobium sp. CS1GBMeth3 TaxID=1892845 RepID=UPI0009317290|nr:peptidoglycan-binding domain-containing protein [Hyphomicrobium sp. CS1GBMeth3]
MRWYISYPVLGAGLIFAADTFFPSAPAVSPPTIEVRRDAAPDIEPGPVVIAASEIMDEPTARIARFSPGAVLLDAELPSQPSPSVLGYLADALLPSRSEPDDVVAPTAPVTVAEWKSAIVRDQELTVTPATAPQQTAVTRAALARDIQIELQRLGCYFGKIDGVWGGGSRRAVLSFMESVNATLPTQEPDVFMLSLIRGQSSAVCGTTSETIVADGGYAPATGDSGSRFEPTMARAVPDRPPLPYGRMGIGGPRPDDARDVASGTTSLTGAAARQPDPPARTAALDAGYSDGTVTPPDLPVVDAASSSFDTDAPIETRRSKPSAAKAKVRPAKRSSPSRHVQHLFTHPLGRM